MDRIGRYEFVGSGLAFSLICILGIFVPGAAVPIAILYLLCNTIRIEEDISDANAFMDHFRRSKGKS